MKILYVTTISLTMNSFFKPHIEMLIREGHSVDLACNFKDLPPDALYSELGCGIYQIDFSRNPISVDNVKAYSQLKRVVESGGYDIVHCHTPNAAVITRLVCRTFRKNNGLKVFYTAHGFHFYKGAPKLNWILFYPVEKFCSRFTDKLITINKEDYELAKAKFWAKDVCCVPGVGIDLSGFENVQVDRKAKRCEMGVPEGAFLLLSVGELNENKNHQVIIKALARLKNPHVHYAIAGTGPNAAHLEQLAKKLGVDGQVHLLGYRKDIPELNYTADVFCFPSIREGLGLAAIEAMACGKPVIAASNRGTNEFVIPGKNGFLCECHDDEAFAAAIGNLISDNEMRVRFSGETQASVQRFRVDCVLDVMKGMYKEI